MAAFHSSAVEELLNHVGKVMARTFGSVDQMIAAADDAQAELKQRLAEKTDALADMERRTKAAEADARRARQDADAAVAETRDLQTQLHCCEEELRNLAKVSQIIAYERENHRLRTELERLRGGVPVDDEPQAAIPVPPPVPEIAPAPAIGVGPIPMPVAPELTMDAAPVSIKNIRSYTRKKIAGAYFFIANDEKRSVHADDDGSVGAVVGHCYDGADGRLRVAWV